MNEIINLALVSFGAMFCYMSFWFIVAILTKRNDLADTAWGLGFIYIALISILSNPEKGIIAWTALALTTLWGLRLAIHVYSRNKGKKEDFRYAQWRKDWGKYFLIRSFLQVFMLQGFLLVIVASPVILATAFSSKIDLSAWYLAGLLLYALGFYFEAVGDWQLTQFIRSKTKSKNKAAVMDKGLWKYTRHPNYFGEVTLWWGQWVILLSSTLPISYKFLGLIGPLTITLLILFVSGIPLLEKKYAKDKAYQAYAKKTAKFFPRNPRK